MRITQQTFIQNHVTFSSRFQAIKYTGIRRRRHLWDKKFVMVAFSDKTIMTADSRLR